MDSEDTILVTGAGGFIGGWLAETLHLRGRAKVRAGIRSWMSAARLARFPMDIVLCDVMDPQQINRALDGVTCVIHCAYGPREVTVQGTQNMLDAALRSRVRRFVHVSTCDVYGYARGEIDEMFPLQDAGTDYSVSKIEAEKLCWVYHDQGLPVTVIRPPIVYGPFCRTWTIELATRLQSGRWGLLKGYGEGTCNLLYIADLVAGVLLAARHPGAVGEAFNLNGPEAMTWNQYWRKFNLALGLPELRERDVLESRQRAALMQPIRVGGKFALKHGQAILKQISQRSSLVNRWLRSTERAIKMTPSPVELRLFNRQAYYAATKAQRLLGYQPRFDLDRGLELTVDWLAHAGLVDQSIVKNRS